MGLIFSDFENYSKSAPGKISLSIVLVLFAYEIGKTAKKPRVMSFLPWIGCQIVVPERVTSGQKNYAGTFDLYQRQKLVQLLTLSKKIYGFTCVLANPKPLFAP